METENGYGNEQQADWDWGHEKLQGEDDGAVVFAVSSMVTCKTGEESGFPSPSPTGSLQKGKQTPPSLFSGIRGPVLGNSHSCLLLLLPVDVGKANLGGPVAHASISCQML